MTEIRGKPTDGVVSRYINRRFSTAMTAAIVRSGAQITPNQVSALSFALGLAAAALYPLGYPALGGVLTQVSSVVDGVDGELARVLKMESKVGAFIDSILDRVVDVAVIIAITLYLLQVAPGPLVAPVAALALSGSLLVSYIHARGEAALGIHPAKIGKFPNIASRDVRLFIVFLGSLAGVLLLTLFAISVLTYSYVAVKVVEAWLYCKAKGPR